MSDIRLNASRVLRIVPSDTIGIPSISSEVVSGSASATTAGKLVDSTKDFAAIGVKVGDIIYNKTDTTAATVTAIDSATTLSVSADIFALGESYSIYADYEQKGVTLFSGDHGGSGHADVRVLTSGGDDVTISGVVKGVAIPIQVKKVFSTGTTIVAIYALW